MHTLIILSLHPFTPVDGATFRKFLSGLVIEAFDSSVGTLLGKASGLAEVDDDVDLGATSIVQRWQDKPGRTLQAAATAVIVVERPRSTFFDIRLELERRDLVLGNEMVHEDVSTINVGSLPSSQSACLEMVPAAFAALPSPGVRFNPALAHVDVAIDGDTPKFEELLLAIDLVLASGKLQNLGLLTISQCRQVAAEIIWNRHQRDMFEDESIAYQTRHEAEALRLAKFIHAASAAVVCERMSEDAGRVVPAAYFYALSVGSRMPISPAQRYDVARFLPEARILADLRASIDARVVEEFAVPLTVTPVPPPMTFAQAAQRLHALG